MDLNFIVCMVCLFAMAAMWTYALNKVGKNSKY